MKREELFHYINLQPEVVKKMENVGNELNVKEIEQYLIDMMSISTAKMSYQQLREYLGEDPGRMKMLFCQLECACRIYDKYKERKIPDNIFVDTMSCFSRFISECEKKSGKRNYDRAWWTYRQLSMNIFRIGELEYQFKVYEDENVIDIHIPSDARLTRELVDESLQKAKDFFNTYYPEYKYQKYTCNSWMLSPMLKELLKYPSNILDFQYRFEVVDENRDDREFIEWIFQKNQDAVLEELPEKTLLQRNVKKLLLQGTLIGTAQGIMK